MVTLSVRHVPDAVYRALRIRAVDHGRSPEDEILAILEEAVLPPRARLGAILAGNCPDIAPGDDEEDRSAGPDDSR
ncbi:FitA-like ribbon-helix-helix domain-containing protein [Nocardia carnea]|uniref:FitA-like ribbon-helix-helix domain-containing protein n=1 Tax=Nocardia carnea TaxID=37328 RepID=UPI002455955E|nr:plasmid stabilization protein [Nocardia carnea]